MLKESSNHPDRMRTNYFEKCRAMTEDEMFGLENGSRKECRKQNAIKAIKKQPFYSPI